ncbi:hypothetical protein [uncultured Erythrobacter sp.]|uniref:hypothetical protein n=1 Tax=uncultured Erythrobacter sp. TaxID=263913 RepID=UPI002613CB2B|nr:hypothetical protein [uncultured Erythrobacter sp.]
MISTAIALIMSLQGVGTTAVAIRNDDPETWTVEYPRVIQPYVADYRGCLTFGMRYVTGVADFEEQHRSDVPRCEQVRAQSIAISINTFADAKTKLTEAQLEELFDDIGKIHIQRGRDLDEQFAMRIAAVQRAEAEGPPARPKPLVIDLPDPSVVKSRSSSPAPSPSSSDFVGK